MEKSGHHQLLTSAYLSFRLLFTTCWPMRAAWRRDAGPKVSSWRRARGPSPEECPRESWMKSAKVCQENRGSRSERPPWAHQSEPWMGSSRASVAQKRGFHLMEEPCRKRRLPENIREEEEEAPGHHHRPALRHDVPRVAVTKRGSRKKLFKIMANPVKVARAGWRFNCDKYARTTVRPKASRNQTFAKVAAGVGFAEPYPLRIETMLAVGGTLKAAGYRTTARYLHEAKLTHIELGHTWTDQLARSMRLCMAAAKRGIGPPKRAAEIRLKVVQNMREAEKEVVRGGPLFARRSWIIASFWLLREIEVAGIRATEEHVAFGDTWAALQWAALDAGEFCNAFVTFVRWRTGGCRATWCAQSAR